MKENNNNEEKKNADKLNLNKKQLESERSNLDKNDSEPNVRRKSEEDKKEEEKKKEKLPIVPYKIDPSYQKKLIAALDKKNKVRPKFLLEPDFDDIRENIAELDKKEEEHEKSNEQQNLNAGTTEKETKEFLTRYKESTFSGETLLQDPMALFSGAEKVYIDQYYKLSDLFVICPLYYNYRISLEYCIYDNGTNKKYEAYHLFNTKEISPPCSHNCCSNQARYIDINIFNFIVDSKDREIQHFISIRKPCRCALSCLCACCSRPTFMIETPIEKIGKIVEMQTTCDPVIKIKDVNDDDIYTITTSCCNCGYCLRDECCNNRKCASCEFLIFGKEPKKPSGKIVKDHRSGKKTKPDYDQLVVTYPVNISCQDKILIMCGALALEYLYFQNLSNSKRCSGNPRFINTFN